MTKTPKKNNNADKSIAGKIKGAMAQTSTVALTILGVVSMVFLVMTSRSIVKNDLSETANVAATLIEREIASMKEITYEIGCNPILANPGRTNEEKIKILQQKVKQYGYTGCGLTMEDNIDIVSGWDCTNQDTVIQALAGNVYFSEPKIHPGSPFTSYFSAPLWKDGIADSKIVGTVIFMSNDHFLQDIVKKISLSDTCQVVLLDQNGNTIADSKQDVLTEIINVIALSEEDSSYRSTAKVYSKMVAGESGFVGMNNSYVAYAPIAGSDGWSIAVSVSKMDYMLYYIVSIVGIIAVMAGALYVSIRIAKKMGAGIAAPIKECSERIRLLATGDLHTEIHVDDTLDEAKVLTTAAAEFVASLQALIQDMDYILAELAQGKFTVESRQESAYVGDFSGMLASVRELKSKLSHTLLQIQESANQVMHGSNQMSTSAQDLAYGASNQTDAVNTLRTTIVNVANGVAENAQQSKMALEKLNEVKEATMESDNEMSKMTEAMERISETSIEIAKIVTGIEDIASQTSLLSLNASIEAARAGEAGRGFAVVAEEIRKLAENSSQSALDTKTLIDAAVSQVQIGNEITERTAIALKRVVAALEEVREGAMASTKLSEEQAMAMRRIEEEIGQITDVVESNSANAQQSSAICEELSAQAIGLNGLVEEFSI